MSLTSVLGKFPAVDFVLHHVGPVECALVQMEVESDGVAKSRDEDAELALVQVDASDLVTVRKDDERLERV